jgi:hypothetical protein
MGTKVGIELNEEVMSALKREDKLGYNRKIVGFLR